MAKKRIVNVGIAGLGRSGWDIHITLLENVKSKYRIVAVFDNDRDRLREAVDRFGCAAYSDYQKMLSDENVELVIIALPSHMHTEGSIQALKAGKDVVCEKPMATCTKDADRMIRWSEKTGRLLTIFQNYRYEPDFLTVRKVIDSGVLGRIVMIRLCYHGFGRRWDWQTLKRFGGGILNNTGPHPLDQALVLFGDKEPEVFCKLEKTLTLGDAEDHVKIILSGKGSPTIEVEITSACAYDQERWLVMGTQGGLYGGYFNMKWKYFDPKRLPKRKVETKAPTGRAYYDEKIPWIEKTSVYKEEGPSPWTGFYTDLYKTLRQNKPLQITPKSVRRQIQIIEKCHKSSSIYK